MFKKALGVVFFITGIIHPLYHGSEGNPDNRETTVRNPFRFPEEGYMVVRNPFLSSSKGFSLWLPFKKIPDRLKIKNPFADVEWTIEGFFEEPMKNLYPILIVFLGFFFSYKDEEVYKRDLKEF